MLQAQPNKAVFRSTHDTSCKWRKIFRISLSLDDLLIYEKPVCPDSLCTFLQKDIHPYASYRRIYLFTPIINKWTSNNGNMKDVYECISIHKSYRLECTILQTPLVFICHDAGHQNSPLIKWFMCVGLSTFVWGQ